MDICELMYAEVGGWHSLQNVFRCIVTSQFEKMWSLGFTRVGEVRVRLHFTWLMGKTGWLRQNVNIYISLSLFIFLAWNVLCLKLGRLAFSNFHQKLPADESPKYRQESAYFSHSEA